MSSTVLLCTLSGEVVDVMEFSRRHSRIRIWYVRVMRYCPPFSLSFLVRECDWISHAYSWRKNSPATRMLCSYQRHCINIRNVSSIFSDRKIVARHPRSWNRKNPMDASPFDRYHVHERQRKREGNTNGEHGIMGIIASRQLYSEILAAENPIPMLTQSQTFLLKNYADVKIFRAKYYILKIMLYFNIF